METKCKDEVRRSLRTRRSSSPLKKFWPWPKWRSKSVRGLKRNIKNWRKQATRRDQERKEALQRLREVCSKKADLEKTLSQAGTPTPTPRGKQAGARPKEPKPKTGESDQLAHDLLASIRQLQGGHVAPFYSIMSQALGNPGKICKTGSLPNIAPLNVLDSNLDSVDLDTKPIIGHVEFANREGGTPSTSHECRGDLNPNSAKTVEVVAGCSAGEGSQKRGKKLVKDFAKEEGQLSDSDSSPDRRSGRKNLKSGILTNPNESGIKQVVSYAHSKLDPIHVKDRVFRELPFHFLVAGELEIILQDEKVTRPVEKVARLNFLRVLCYHKHYLDLEDIKDQYVAILQLIEKGEVAWSDFRRLSDQMHTNLTFRATVKSRERETATVAKLEKLVTRLLFV